MASIGNLEYLKPGEYKLAEEKIDEKEITKEIDMTELKKMIKSNKDLAFVKNYIENERNEFQYY